MSTTPARRGRRHWRRAGGRAAGLAGLALALSGCSHALVNFGFPDPVTRQGPRVLALWRGSMVAALTVGTFVLGLIVWSAVAYRKRSDDLPSQVHYNLPIEVLYTVVPFVIVAVLFYFTAVDENYVNKLSPKPDLKIDVVGFQWSWQFIYVDDGLQITGRPGSPPQLVVPTGEKIQFTELSPDVIHSWWVVPFLFKRDVIPGRPNRFELTVDKVGTFKGRCAELCGVNHDRMLFSVLAVSPADFQTFLAAAKSEAAAGTNPAYTVSGSSP